MQPIGVWVERRRSADGDGDTIELGWLVSYSSLASSGEG